MDFGDQRIPARSRREAMDWGLVLASQNIEAMIVRTDEGWGLVVSGEHFASAQSVLRQYQLENHGWRWKQKLPGSGLAFHNGAMLWVAVMAAFYYWTMIANPNLQSAGMMSSEEVLAGQWWRVFTAVTLHADLAHLAGNLLAGGLLLGLAMSRYGPGVTLLAAFLAGAAGNCADLIFYPAGDRSLGASGMVMGALGLLSVHTFSYWRKFPAARHLMFRGAAAGILILALLGFSPGTDMVAHVGGFMAGAALGLGLNLVRPRHLLGAAANGLCALALAALVLTAWQHALRHGP